MNDGGRRVLICAALLLCAAGAGAAGYALGARSARTARAVTAVAEAETKDPLQQFRTERGQLRGQQTAQLNDIIYNPASGEESVRLAQRKLLDLLEQERVELELEGLLKNRGFADALVCVDGGAASVLVRGESLTKQESAMILELVLRQTGLTGGNVKIIPVN